jgi:hypothetical protein
MITGKAVKKREQNLLNRRMNTSMTLPIEQVKWLDYVASQKDITRSRFVSEMIDEEQRRRQFIDTGATGQEHKETAAA